MKTIGILGSGQVAQALGKGFIKNGYDVMLGTRDAGKLKEWKESAGERARIGTFEEASEFGGLVVLAVKGTIAEDLVGKLSGLLKNKTVVDATNPIADVPPQNGVLQFFTGANESLMERLQKISSAANFVKAFNSVGSSFMVDPSFPEGKPTMFICGNSENAKKEVTEILHAFHWEVTDMGKAEAARAIESLCILWCIPGFIRNEWMHAFKLLKK